MQPDSSPFPRTPPNEPPPPVPPNKPRQKDINDASNNILLSLDELEKKSNFSRGKNRRRRASLPGINMLPSFKSLKSAMGFGVDDNDDKSNDEEIHKPLNGDVTDTKNNKMINNLHNHDKMNDKNTKTINKKINPKEIKQIYIKNLKLQAQLDKMKEREKQYEYKLQEAAEQVSELRIQVNHKNQVLKSLHDQVSRSENVDKRVKQLERLLVEKDTQIQSLKQAMQKIQRNDYLNTDSYIPSSSPSSAKNNSPHRDHVECIYIYINIYYLQICISQLPKYKETYIDPRWI